MSNAEPSLALTQRERVDLYKNNVRLRQLSFGRTFLYSAIMRGKNTPLAPSLVAFCVSAVNGYVQARYLTNYAYYDLSWFYDPRFLIGHVLFLLGMAINIHSDSILRSLRTPGETAYKIPHGEHTTTTPSTHSWCMLVSEYIFS